MFAPLKTPLVCAATLFEIAPIFSAYSDSGSDATAYQALHIFVLGRLCCNLRRFE